MRGLVAHKRWTSIATPSSEEESVPIAEKGFCSVEALQTLMSAVCSRRWIGHAIIIESVGPARGYITNSYCVLQNCSIENEEICS